MRPKPGDPSLGPDPGGSHTGRYVRKSCIENLGVPHSGRPHGLGFPEEEDQEGACVEVLGLGPEVSPTWPAVRSVALFWADPIGIPCKNSYGSFEAKK